MNNCSTEATIFVTVTPTNFKPFRYPYILATDGRNITVELARILLVLWNPDSIYFWVLLLLLLTSAYEHFHSLD